MKVKMNSLGMFDICKGIGMIIIIMGHTFSEYDMMKVMASSGPIVVALLGLFAIVSSILIPVLFLISGYGFRKQALGVTVKQQLQMFIKPYLVVVLIALIGSMVKMYILTGSVRASIWESRAIVLSYALMLPKNLEINGNIYAYAVVMWYFAALVIGWIMLQMVLKLENRVVRICILLAMTLVGWFASANFSVPFALPQALIAVTFLYVGYLAKTQKFFTKSLGKKDFAIIVCSLIASLVGCLVIQNRDDMAGGSWGLGPISVVADAILALYLLYFALKLNNYDNKIMAAFGSVGRYSYYLFMIHAVEMHIIPWYMMSGMFIEHPIQGWLIECVVRLLLDVGLTFGIVKGMKYIRSL